MDRWRGEFAGVFDRVAGRFAQVQSRLRARGYLLGLLSQTERKNGWSIAEFAGDADPQGMQRLLNHYRWDADAARDDLRGYVVERLGDDRAVLVVDETGFVKKGRRSAGVQRQYTGTSGKIDNCQLGVFLAYASRHGRALVDRELYLPRSWVEDAGRCAEAGVPAGVGFATKPELARRMLERAATAGVPFGWVAGDEVYGQHAGLRTWLEGQRIGYVLAVPCSQPVVPTAAGLARADTLAGRLPRAAWQRYSCGDGAKGPRLYDWALIATVRPEQSLLVRRPVGDGEHAYFLCHTPTPTPLAELVRVAGSRWAIEECFQSAKNETGLDHYQVRRYDAWYRHITLSMLAHAFLAVLAGAAEKGDPAAVDNQPAPA
ncbi:MAG: IS701 family transposase [Sporichthyaceae bacterium]|nr:IS701 family transposase [Sporichthyaceae bacterium]